MSMDTLLSFSKNMSTDRGRKNHAEEYFHHLLKVFSKEETLMKGNTCLDVIDDKHVHVDAELQNKDLDQVILDKISDQQAKVISQFEKLVSSGPDYVCSCCTQTVFGQCMKNVEKQPEAKTVSVSKFCYNV